MTEAASSPGQRGPADHNIREQIVEAANAHFGHYGYGKTTVSDLAKAIGFSKAYIYKFFDSKQAIGEAICSGCLGNILVEVEQGVAGAGTATEKLRLLFKIVVAKSLELFFAERKLYDIAIHSVQERWPSSEAYVERIRTILSDILREGRENGEFERKTPIDETGRAIIHVMKPFFSPIMLEHNLDEIPDGPNEVMSLILRSLAP